MNNNNRISSQGNSIASNVSWHGNDNTARIDNNSEVFDGDNEDLNMDEMDNEEDIPGEPQSSSRRQNGEILSSIHISRHNYLEYPSMYITPPKMCSVNKWVQCVSAEFFNSNQNFISRGPEFMLLGPDSPALPTHMLKWIWAMNALNNLQCYEKCIVPLKDITELKYKKDHMKQKVVGVTRKSEICKDYVIDNSVRFFHGMSGQFQDGYAARVLDKDSGEYEEGDSLVYQSKVNFIEFSWELLPLQYHSKKLRCQQRRVYHTLRTVPVPGFDLLKLFCVLENNRSQKWKNNVTIDDILRAVSDVYNHECNVNLGIDGGFDRESFLPSPMNVNHDSKNMLNGKVILSPFLIVEKLPHILDFGDVEDLIIDNFPCVCSKTEQELCESSFQKFQRQYRYFIIEHDKWFVRALNSVEKANKSAPASSSNKPAKNRANRHPTNNEEVVADNVSEINGVVNNIDEIADVSDGDISKFTDEFNKMVLDKWDKLQKIRASWSSLHMLFKLDNWCDGILWDKCELLRFPQLTIATITPFQYVDMIDGDSLNFIKAHLGNDNVNVNETQMKEKYGKESNSWGDLPHSCMYRTSRTSLQTSLATIPSEKGVFNHYVPIFKTYDNYLHAQSTFHTQAVASDLFMSDRVLYASKCLNYLSNDINKGIGSALTKELKIEELLNQNLCTSFHPDYAAFTQILHVLSMNNEHLRANPMNLSVLWAFMISDVLTHLGSHHENWMWMMYTVNVLGGNGHLRATTDDHSSRVPVIFTSKPNSVGFNVIITKTMKAMVGLIHELIPTIEQDHLDTMKFMKLDRTTRTGVENMSSVLFVNNVKDQIPSRRTFMRNMIMDEGYRSIDASALNGLVCSIPRDSDGGTGNILKSIDPGNKGGAHLQGHQKQIPGFSLFLIGLTSNSNPHTATIGESIKSLSVVAANFPPGAQQGGSLSMTRNKTHNRINDYIPCTTNSASSMPKEKKEREALAWTTSVLWMAVRQLALINKTGQIDFEPTTMYVKYIEWVRNLMAYLYQSMFGSMLYPSYDRVIAGYIARQVATTMIFTTAKNITATESMVEANKEILKDMESSPLTLQSLNVALGNAMMHLVDTNLILVQKFFHDELQTPFFDLDTLVMLFDREKPRNLSHEIKQNIIQFLQSINHPDLKRPQQYLYKGFIGCQNLATTEDYMSKETYLEAYCGITKGSYYTYTAAFRECMAKKFDFYSLFNLDPAHANIERLYDIVNMDVPAAPAMPYGNQQNLHVDGMKYIIIDLTETKQIQRVHINCIQHLFLNALLGDRELHSDNVFHMGANIFHLFLQRSAPPQVAPFSTAIYEHFVQVRNDVVPLRINFKHNLHPDYFLRAINDYGMEEYGQVTEMPKQIMNHPPEDTMHMGAWLRLQSILFAGKSVECIHPLPEYNGRIPELVPGRIYPLLKWYDQQQSADVLLQNINDSNVLRVSDAMSLQIPIAITGYHQESTANVRAGTICVCPSGLSRAITVFPHQGIDSVKVMDMNEWKEVLQKNGVMVAPLIFRKHAVVMVVNNRIGVIVPWEEDNNPYYQNNFGRFSELVDDANRLQLEAEEQARNQQQHQQRAVPAATVYHRDFTEKRLQFLSYVGNYCVKVREIINGIAIESLYSVDFSTVHQGLMAIGSTLYVNAAKIHEFGIYDIGNAHYIKCYLRYPDEVRQDPSYRETASSVTHVYFSIKVKTNTKVDTMHVRHLNSEYVFPQRPNRAPNSNNNNAEVVIRDSVGIRR